MAGMALFSLILMAVIGFLAVKILLLHRAADEIGSRLKERLTVDTNTLITLSSRDKHMRRLAEEMNSQLRILRKERQRFRQGDLEMKERITNVSHDLRTPLTAICGYLDLLKEEEKPENAQRYILGSVLEESISAYYAALTGCRIIPEISISERKPVRKLNRNALLRVFGNVIGNAIKYSGGDLKIELTDSGEVIFSNKAPGLDEVQTSQLFNRFYTVETAGHSTGIGLSIARLLVEQMNGEITAVYREGRLWVRIYFPG